MNHQDPGRARPDVAVTATEMLNDWPELTDPPSLTTLRKWLNRAIDLGFIVRRGTGMRNVPFRYLLPAMEVEWEKNGPDFARWRAELELEMNQLQRHFSTAPFSPPLDMPPSTPAT